MIVRDLYLGIDCGTSGMRAVVINEAGQVQHELAEPLPPSVHHNDGTITQEPQAWAQALDRLIERLPQPKNIARLAIDGTSGTILLCDGKGRPLTPGRMYNCPASAAHAREIAAVAPAESAAHGATSPLARLLDMQTRHPDAASLMHQADWLAGRLTSRFGVSDDNNALKTGYDPVRRIWPDWLDRLGVRRDLLPLVTTPGAMIGYVTGGPLIGAEVLAGTTDGCASFLATGADGDGDGVSALGSTLTVKLLSAQPVFAPVFGIYSHRLGKRWLAGGASNSGGDALARYFSGERIAALSSAIDLDAVPDRDWHPLPGKGERFPVNDPAMTFEPDACPGGRPGHDAAFLAALMDGVARVETLAYDRLAQAGSTPLASMRSVGTGAGNAMWTALRARRLNVPMLEPLSLQAAYGSARLAAQRVPGLTRRPQVGRG